MQFSIEHSTTYTYSQPVILEPHVLRLTPRNDGHQGLRSHALQISPDPLGQSLLSDFEGNAAVKVWFAPQRQSELVVTVRSQVETLCTNPFNYLLEPWAQQLPFNYPASVLNQIQPYLVGSPWRSAVDGEVAALAQEVSQGVNGNVSQFLTALNQRICDSCDYIFRELGAPFPAGYTWKHKRGSCRDLTVLFMEACRAMGLAARFVSGYQCLTDIPPEDGFQLHAWAEVYLPGAGWRGFDPTQRAGAVADRYIALVASVYPSDTTPVAGAFSQGNGSQSQMESTVMIQVTAPVASQYQASD
jgi:transglutaminase-like putative cysteine protease